MDCGVFAGLCFGPLFGVFGACATTSLFNVLQTHFNLSLLMSTADNMRRRRDRVETRHAAAAATMKRADAHGTLACGMLLGGWWVFPLRMRGGNEMDILRQQNVAVSSVGMLSQCHYTLLHSGFNIVIDHSGQRDTLIHARNHRIIEFE